MINNHDPRVAEGLRPIINVSGTMTSLGASIVVPEAVEAMRAFLPQFVEIGDLQRKASAEIALTCGSEAGYVTACTAAGITLAIAGAMTGTDLCAIERLPDATGLKHEVPIQMGHMCHYGAPVEQAIRLAGARPVPLGTATRVEDYQLAGALNERTAAALFVVSHHVVHYGQIPLRRFAEICHSRGVPVIVDAASEYDLTGFLEQGADVAIYSAHKFLGGPTAGIVAGRKDLIRAAYLQNSGIGRKMKVGKESVIGTVAALRAWRARDHAGVRARERQALDLWRERLAALPGLSVSIVPDPTGNPLDRLELRVDPQHAKLAAWDLADRLAAGEPPVIVRDHEVEHGFFLLDPCNLHPGQDLIVAERIEAICRHAQGEAAPPSSLAARHARRQAAMLAWPD